MPPFLWASLTWIKDAATADRGTQECLPDLAFQVLRWRKYSAC